MKPYPIFLVDLASRPCIVIGGGNEGEFKVKGLLDCDAAVTMISLHLTPQLQTWAEEGWLTWIKRHYLPGDLEGAFLVIAERSDPETNAQIWQEAQTEGALINVMDDVPHCNFVAGSVIRRGPLVVSISTSGAAPRSFSPVAGATHGGIWPGISNLSHLDASPTPTDGSSLPGLCRTPQTLVRYG